MPTPKKYATQLKDKLHINPDEEGKVLSHRLYPATRRWEKMRKQVLTLFYQVVAEAEIHLDQHSEIWQESGRVEEFIELMESKSGTATTLKWR